MQIEDIQFVPLTQGKFAIIDYADREEILAFRWYFRGGYALRGGGTTKNRSTVFMHRVILKPPVGMIREHANRQGLDNRRSNLRSATHSQNAANAKMRATNKSGYRGVRFDKRAQLWRAVVNIGGKAISLRYHNTPEAAARAYDAKAREVHGAFAHLNFPEE